MAAVQLVLHQVRHRPEALCHRATPQFDGTTCLCQPTRVQLARRGFGEARLHEDMLSTLKAGLLLLRATRAMGYESWEVERNRTAALMQIQWEMTMPQ